jgi:uncharacterized repeat protein (TIGR03803 family)
MKPCKHPFVVPLFGLQKAIGRLFVFLILTVAAASAQTFTSLVDFAGSNGANPDPKALIQGADGNLYGTAQNGGANSSGTVFRLTPSGMLTTLYDFCALPGCADGANPVPGLVLGNDGNFYGVTSGGGTSGVGTVFKITLQGSLITLNSLNAAIGSFPFSRLVQGPDGNFYGTTPSGGNLVACSGFGCGTVFRITPGGALSNLYSFCSQPGCSDGAVAFDGLALGRDGNLYGTTWQGGGANLGTVFRITTVGSLTTLYSFCSQSGCVDGNNPDWLTLGKDGNFYGTTFGGGAQNLGTVFVISASGSLTKLYSFCSQAACADGAQPRAGLELAQNTGEFYGTTYYGGSNNLGSVFKITPSGQLTTLHSFTGVDGEYPIGGMLFLPSGVAYGTTAYGGSTTDGTAFSLTFQHGRASH